MSSGHSGTTGNSHHPESLSASDGHQTTSASVDIYESDLKPGSVLHFANGQRIRITDMMGRTLELETPVERVICLRAGALRMLSYLQATSLAIGIEEPERHADRPYIHANPELRKLHPVGPLMGGDAELLAAAQPDLLFVTFMTAAQADDLQQRTGIPVVGLLFGDFFHRRSEFYSSLELMAAIIDRSDRARELITGIEASLEDLELRTANIPTDERPRTYIGGVSYRGARGISSTQPNYPPFSFIQSRNVASEIHPRSVDPIQGTYIDKEQLIIWDPDVLFIDLSGWETSRGEIAPGTPLYRSLSSVRNGRVYGLLPYNNYASNYESVLANAWFAGKTLYPERFEDICITRKTNRIFELFLGAEVYDDIVRQTGGFRPLLSGSGQSGHAGLPRSHQNIPAR